MDKIYEEKRRIDPNHVRAAQSGREEHARVVVQQTHQNSERDREHAVAVESGVVLARRARQTHVLATIQLDREPDQQVAQVARQDPLLHRRSRHLRLRDVRGQQFRAVLYQLRERKASTTVLSSIKQ